MDYDFEPISVTFSPGVTRVPFNVTIIDDDVPEGNEYLTLRIYDLLSGVLFGFPYYCVISIVDDDDTTITNVDSKLLLL